MSPTDFDFDRVHGHVAETGHEALPVAFLDRSAAFEDLPEPVRSRWTSSSNSSDRGQRRSFLIEASLVLLPNLPSIATLSSGSANAGPDCAIATASTGPAAIRVILAKWFIVLSRVSLLREVWRLRAIWISAKLVTIGLFPSRRTRMTENLPLHVSLVAVPGTLAMPIAGLYEVLTAFPVVANFHEGVPASPPFAVEIVGTARTTVAAGSGLPITIQRAVDKVDQPGIVIVPTMAVDDGWTTGRHPDLCRVD